MIDNASKHWEELPSTEATSEQQRSVIARVDQIITLKKPLYEMILRLLKY